MTCLSGISSMSLGRAWEHALFNKLSEASRAGFAGVEIFYEDLAYLATTYDPEINDQSEGSPSEADLLRAAKEVRKWCQNLQLEVICLQPFMSYEGLTDRTEHDARIEKMKLWLMLCKILQTDLILVPSTFQAIGTTGDLHTIVKDMLELADLGAAQSPAVRFAYENLAWGTHVDTWEQVWKVVEQVDRPNFGMCIDTFNICGRIWADPTSPEGKLANADRDLAASLDRFVSTVKPAKIFFIQVIDAERMQEQLIKGHPWYQEDQPARMSWSRNARLFAYEEGGYLPIERVLEAVFKGVKWKGWVSMELFSRTMGDPDGSVPETHAQRGIHSWRKIKEIFDL